MDIHITYETLFDLLRKERSLDDLQELNKWFWKHVVDYLNERESFLETTSQLEQEKTRIQLFNIKRIIREIYERRERKIMQLAMNVVRSNDPGFVDKRSMLAEEVKLFDETISLLLTYKRGVLDQVCAAQLPIICPKAYDESSQEGLEFKKEKVEKKTEIKEEQRIQSKSTDDEKADLDSIDHSQDENTLVKFKIPVPKFLGKNKEVFGPFEKDTVTSLPNNIAMILLKKEKVEKVLAV